LVKALAATGLATRLPSFAQGIAFDQPDAPAQDDTPTRTDHPLPGATPGSRPEADAAALYGIDSSAVGQGPRPPAAPHGWPWFVGAGAVALTLLAHQSHRLLPSSAPAAPVRAAAAPAAGAIPPAPSLPDWRP
jgi:hypothetical protein